VRWIVVLVFALALLAYELGLDLLLGGFAAGLITRQMLRAREIPGFDARLTAVAFGFFIPFFFVVSGMQLDVDACSRASRGWSSCSCSSGCFSSCAGRRRCCSIAMSWIAVAGGVGVV
jgi:Kef-type K+ transport system membrane component KefB